VKINAKLPVTKHKLFNVATKGKGSIYNKKILEIFCFLITYESISRSFRRESIRKSIIIIIIIIIINTY
jgi:hypothetical protein